MKTLVAMFLLFTPCPGNLPPTLSGTCTYGTVTQEGRKLVIDGDSWLGIGEIHGDVVIIIWLSRACHWDGRAGVGIYEIRGLELVGKWGYSDRVERYGFTLAGAEMDETIRVEKCPKSR
jgi:hypothetical protein